MCVLLENSLGRIHALLKYDETHIMHDLFVNSFVFSFKISHLIIGCPKVLYFFYFKFGYLNQRIVTKVEVLVKN